MQLCAPHDCAGAGVRSSGVRRSRAGPHHLQSHLHECWEAELPFAADLQREEVARSQARRRFTRASNAGSLSAPPEMKLINGAMMPLYDPVTNPGPPRTPRGAGGADHGERPATAVVPRPPTGGVRRFPPPPPGECSPRAPRRPQTHCRGYHETDPGFGGEPDRDIIFNDPPAPACTAGGSASLSNSPRAPHSSRPHLKPRWGPPHTVHPWQMREGRLDQHAFRKVWEQEKRHTRRIQHARDHFRVDYGSLKGAALSLGSPRFVAERAAAEAAADEAHRREVRAARQQKLADDRARYLAAHPEARGKPLSQSLRAAIFETVQRLYADSSLPAL